jgi:hypothetical protein
VLISAPKWMMHVGKLRSGGIILLRGTNSHQFRRLPGFSALRDFHDVTPFDTEMYPDGKTRCVCATGRIAHGKCELFPHYRG